MCIARAFGDRQDGPAAAASAIQRQTGQGQTYGVTMPKWVMRDNGEWQMVEGCGKGRPNPTTARVNTCPASKVNKNTSHPWPSPATQHTKPRHSIPCSQVHWGAPKTALGQGEHSIHTPVSNHCASAWPPAHTLSFSSPAAGVKTTQPQHKGPGEPKYSHSLGNMQGHLGLKPRPSTARQP